MVKCKGTVVLTAGGTGGHVFPALAVAQALKQQGYALHWLGTSQGIEAGLVPQHEIPLSTIDIKGLRGKGFVTKLLAPLNVVRATGQALTLLRQLKPVGVLGMGGYVTGPVGLAAWMIGCPLVIHEQNAVAGLTNRLLARLSRAVLCAFPGAFSYLKRPEACSEGGQGKTRRPLILTGNPVREAIIQIPEPVDRLSNREGPVRILVVGGSLGAKAINEVVPGAIDQLFSSDGVDDLMVWHQCGQAHLAPTEQAYGDKKARFKIEPFIDNMAAAYEWADLVVCRAGALTVSEVAAAGVAALFVPFPHAVDDHQTKNAEVLVKAGAALLLPQAQLTASHLAEVLKPLLNDRMALQEMAIRGRNLAHRDATQQVAEIFLDVCGK